MPRLSSDCRHVDVHSETLQLSQTAPFLRLGVFVVVFAAVAAWEFVAPRRRQAVGRRTRWPGNVGIAVFNAAMMRVVIPSGAVGMALYAQARGWGLFNVLATPTWIATVASVVILDLTIYCQHVVFHAVPFLWRVHRMHHADVELDVTSGARFHPVELALSMGLKAAAVIALGAPPVAVLAFEVLLNATSMFNHGNIAMSRGADRLLRLLLVTPDMHRVHHSVIRRETDSNFGFSLPWWDWLFGTYRAAPEAGQTGMTIGIPSFREAAEGRLDRMLSQPFRRESLPDRAAPSHDPA